MLRVKKLDNKEVVLNAVKHLCELKSNSINNDCAEVWLTTREVAEYCGISIYQAHYSLTRLAAQLDIKMNVGKKKRSLSWSVSSSLD